MKKTKVLVTGASGFIGQALGKKLVADGWPVAGAVRNESAAGKLPVEVESVIVGDVGPDTDWVPALSGVEFIVHLAARVHVMHDRTAEAIALYRTVNVAGTERLAETAVSMGVKRLIYLSSVKVNGEGKPRPYTERDPPQPADPYALSKYEAEQRLQDITTSSNMEVVVFRPPLVYGPGVGANFRQLLKAVAKGIPLPLASVKNQRSLIFLGNLIDAIITSLEHSQAAGKTFLLSDGNNISTPELIRMIASVWERPPRLMPFPTALLRLAAKIVGQSEALKRLLDSLIVDTSKIQSELGWEPPFSMEEGLNETVKWYLLSLR